MAVVLNVHCTHLILELRSALKRSPIVQLTAVEIELHPSALAGEGVGGQEGVARVCAVWTHTSCVRATLGLATEGRPPPARPCLPRGGAVRPRTPVRCLHHGGGVRLCQQLTRRAGSRCRGDGSPTRAPSFPPSPHAQCDRERPWGWGAGPSVWPPGAGASTPWSWSVLPASLTCDPSLPSEFSLTPRLPPRPLLLPRLLPQADFARTRTRTRRTLSHSSQRPFFPAQRAALGFFSSHPPAF